MNETKALLLNIFRLTLAISNHNQNEAISTFSNILDGVIVLDGHFGDISSISNVDDDGIKLVINEEKLVNNEEPVQVAVPVVSGQTTYNFPANVNDIQDNRTMEETKDGEDDLEDDEVVEDDDEVVEEEQEDDEVVEDDHEVVEEEQEDDVEDDEVVEEEQEDDVEVVEVEQEEEEVELNLEPVRIKKVLYWKDLDNGDLYSYLPNDEVGDLVGSYMDGKLILNQ